ncbi:hypothetical protein CVT26_016206 [Gymnopilus dilepis]|uniref:SAP domain-containing protein n=1 Tax=Gymnopilus dilepis TaxID=231916 RepID=A0A409XYY4_9AGAR|nr:hypothetical protein CVT26_016206 [Gymnopilus dilepis]
MTPLPADVLEFWRWMRAVTVVSTAVFLVVWLWGLYKLGRLFLRNRRLAAMDVEMDPRNDDSRLPFPGGVEDGQVTVQHLSIDIKKPDLSELCRRFGLGVTGNKDELKARLWAFSANRDGWQKFVPTARRMHRGPKMGAVVKAKSVKQSTRRANEIFNSGSTSNKVLPHLPNRLPASEGQGVAPQSQHIIAWAKAFSSAHPYVSSEERAAAGKARLERMRAERQQQLVLSTAPGPLDYTNARLDHSVASPSVMSNSMIHGIQPSSSITLPLPSEMLNVPSLVMPSAPILGTDALPAPSSTALMPTDPIDPAPSIHSHRPAPYPSPGSRSLQKTKTRTLKLRNGTIARAFTSQLSIGERCMAEQRPVHLSNLGTGKGSEGEFWSEFSDSSGHRLSYTAIVDRLSALRAKEDQKLAAEARAAFGEQFAEVFLYKKNGTVYVKESD